MAHGRHIQKNPDFLGPQLRSHLEPIWGKVWFFRHLNKGGGRNKGRGFEHCLQVPVGYTGEGVRRSAKAE